MNNEDKKHRSHLPMPNTQRPQFIAYDAKDPLIPGVCRRSSPSGQSCTHSHPARA